MPMTSHKHSLIVNFHFILSNLNFREFAKTSGLLGKEFTELQFVESYTIKGNSIVLVNKIHADKIGQIVARYLREAMIRLKRRFKNL